MQHNGNSKEIRNLNEVIHKDLRNYNNAQFQLTVEKIRNMKFMRRKNRDL